MKTHKIGKDFEIIALEYLKKKFKNAIWLSKNKNYVFDFVCEDENGEVLFGDAKVISRGSSPTLRYEQRDADFVIAKKKDNIEFIWKSNFKNNVIIGKEDSEFIKISKELKDFLDRSKVHPSETYQEIIKRLLKRGGTNL